MWESTLSLHQLSGGLTNHQRTPFSIDAVWHPTNICSTWRIRNISVKIQLLYVVTRLSSHDYFTRTGFWHVTENIQGASSDISFIYINTLASPVAIHLYPRPLISFMVEFTGWTLPMCTCQESTAVSCIFLVLNKCSATIKENMLSGRTFPGATFFKKVLPVR